MDIFNRTIAIRSWTYDETDRFLIINLYSLQMLRESERGEKLAVWWVNQRRTTYE